MIFIITSSFLLGGCLDLFNKGDDSETDKVNSFIAASKSTPRIAAISDDDLLLALLREGMKRQSMLISGRELMMVQADAATASATNSTAATAVSTTNIQVAGVDEADRMKSDGQFLYAIKSDRQYQAKNQLRIFSLTAAPASQHIVDIEVGQVDDGSLNGLYLLDNQRVLLLYGGGGFHYFDLWWDPWSWQGYTNVIEIVDVTDSTNPVTESRVVIDGTQVSSRMVGNHLYLLNRYTPNIDSYTPYPNSNTQENQNSLLLAEAKLDDLLPTIDTGSGSEPLADANNCYLPPIEDIEKLSADVISLIDINIDDPAQWQSRCIIGSTETLFMTPTSAYLATSRYNYDASVDQIVYSSDVSMVTDIHKFSLTTSGPEYRGSGQVPGQLGWDRKKKPFRFGEYNDIVGVLSSDGNDWSCTSTADGKGCHRLTLLEEGGSSGLVIRKTLAGLGKPGEKLYSSRFMGDRVYLVTFKQTDPLYVIDISDPDNLQKGELQVPGFSDYLHPLPGGYLLGVGKDAVDATAQNNGFWGDEGRFAWYQGLKLALYDVNDVQNPVELVNTIIGKRGTSSTANYDHHGFIWLPADTTTGRLARLALPVELHNEPVSVTYGWEWAEWTHTGLKMFEIDDGAISGVPAINEKADLVVESRSTTKTYPTTGIYQDRGVIAGDSIYYLRGDQIWSGSWGSPTIADGPIPAN